MKRKSPFHHLNVSHTQIPSTSIKGSGWMSAVPELLPLPLNSSNWLAKQELLFLECQRGKIQAFLLLPSSTWCHAMVLYQRVCWMGKKYLKAKLHSRRLKICNELCWFIIGALWWCWRESSNRGCTCKRHVGRINTEISPRGFSLQYI